MDENFARIDQLDFYEFIRTTDSVTRRIFAERFVSQFQKPNAGFARLVNHGFDSASRDLLLEQWAIFFQQPPEVKQKYIIPGRVGQEGYTAFRVEGESSPGMRDGDLSEFYQVGQIGEDYPPNVWPEEIPGLEEVIETTRGLYEKYERFGDTIYALFSLGTGHPEDYFKKQWLGKKRNATLKIIWYSRIETDVGTIYRARRHCDSSFYSSLLINNKVKGLRLNLGTKQEPRWVYAPTEVEDMLINLGKEGEYVMDGVGIATEHEVVIPSFPSPLRRVIAFFEHAPLDVSLPRLCTHPTNPGGIYKGVVRSNTFLYRDLAGNRKDVPNELLER